MLLNILQGTVPQSQAPTEPSLRTYGVDRICAFSAKLNINHWSGASHSSTPGTHLHLDLHLIKIHLLT